MCDDTEDTEQEHEYWSEGENFPNGTVKRVFKIVIAAALICAMLFAGSELRKIYSGMQIIYDLRETVAWQEIFDLCEDQFEILRKGEFRKAAYVLSVDADSENIEAFSFANHEQIGKLPQEEIDALDYLHTSKELPGTIDETYSISNKMFFFNRRKFSYSIGIWYSKPDWGNTDPVMIEKIRDGYYLQIRSRCYRSTELGRSWLWAIIITSMLLLSVTIRFQPKPRKSKPRSTLTGVDTSTLVQRCCAYATVTDKQMRKIAGISNHRYECNVEFTYDDGNRIVLDTSMPFYYEIQIGERRLLTIRNGYFDDFSDENGEFAEEIDEFSLDDYDEAIDVPFVDTYEPDGLFSPDERRESTEEEKVFEQKLQNGEILPPCVLHSDSESHSLPAYSPMLLIQLSGMYPFMRRIREIGELFEEAFRIASQDLLGDQSLPRTGETIRSVTLHHNVFQVCVTIKETMIQEDYEIKSDFSINTNLPDGLCQ